MPEPLRGPHAVPAGLFEHLGDRFALRRLGGPPRDFLERGLQLLRCRRELRRAAGSGVGKRDARQIRIIQHDHPLDEVLELANVARIAMAREALHHRPRHDESVAAVELRVPFDEVVHQHGDFGHALPQRGQPDGNDRQTIVKVLAKLAFRHGPLQVLVGGGEYPHVDARVDLPFANSRLEDVEQLGLERRCRSQSRPEHGAVAASRLPILSL